MHSADAGIYLTLRRDKLWQYKNIAVFYSTLRFHPHCAYKLKKVIKIKNINNEKLMSHERKEFLDSFLEDIRNLVSD